MSIYRTNANVSKIKPEFGLIRVLPVPPHVCSTPGFLSRLWLWLTFRGIPEGSLYRCECGRVWRNADCVWWFSAWDETNPLSWVNAGGYLPPLLQQKAERLLSEENSDDEDEECCGYCDECEDPDCCWNC
jgi:hypothetical protein